MDWLETVHAEGNAGTAAPQANETEAGCQCVGQSRGVLLSCVLVVICRKKIYSAKKGTEEGRHKRGSINCRRRGCPFENLLKISDIIRVTTQQHVIPLILFCYSASSRVGTGASSYNVNHVTAKRAHQLITAARSSQDSTASPARKIRPLQKN